MQRHDLCQFGQNGINNSEDCTISGGVTNVAWSNVHPHPHFPSAEIGPTKKFLSLREAYILDFDSLLCLKFQMFGGCQNVFLGFSVGSKP